MAWLRDRTARGNAPPRAGSGGAAQRVQATARSPSAAAATLVAGAVFLAAGAASGLLIDRHGGVVGALEWLLRTTVVVAAIAFLIAGSIVVLRLRRRMRRASLGWMTAVVASVNRLLAGRAGGSVQHWNLPDAPHGSAIEADPAGYERRVLAFLDGALRSDRR